MMTSAEETRGPNPAKGDEEADDASFVPPIPALPGPVVGGRARAAPRPPRVGGSRSRGQRGEGRTSPAAGAAARPGAGALHSARPREGDGPRSGDPRRGSPGPRVPGDPRGRPAAGELAAPCRRPRDLPASLPGSGRAPARRLDPCRRSGGQGGAAARPRRAARVVLHPGTARPRGVPRPPPAGASPAAGSTPGRSCALSSRTSGVGDLSRGGARSPSSW